MKGCSRSWEVDALREGRLSAADAASHRRHRSTCDECRHRFESDERSAELARELATPAPDPLTVRRQRAEIMRRAAVGELHRSRARWGFAAAGTFVAVAVLALVFSTRTPTIADPPANDRSRQELPAERVAASYASVVTALGSASWERRRVGNEETVRLADGMISLTVRKQSPEERFIVEVPDGRIEVRGTRFEVEVKERVTERVTVDEGVVAWTPTGQQTSVLSAGEAWRRPAPAPVFASARSAPSRPITSVQAAPSAAGAIAESDEYSAAIAAYRAREYDDAASRFGAFVTAHPRAPEAEDAAFLEASSLAHAGRTDAAALVAERFLRQHPRSIHARDAAVLVARSARDRGDCEKARNALHPWSDDDASSGDVATALGSCR